MKVQKIQLQLYFHIFEATMWHLFSSTCISKNVLKCILKHVIIQYYAMKSKDLPLIKVKHIHDFNVLSFSLWIFSTKKKTHWYTLPCFYPNQ